MWKIFRRDPYAKIDRRKQLAEKRHMKERERSRRRRNRREAWQDFEKRFKKFLDNPFAKKELTSIQREARWAKKMQRRDRRLMLEKWWKKFRMNPLRVIFPRKKRRAEGGGYLYIYHMTKQERKALAKKQSLERKKNFKKVFTEPDLRSKFIVSFLYSTANFVLAFLLLYVIYQVVTIMIASSFNIPVTWYYYKLKFDISDFSPLYTRTALVSIFAAGPIISLMIGFVFLKLFFSKHKIIRRFQLFYLWGFICGSNMFFGSYISGFFTRTEFIYTSEWLFMSNVFDIEEIIFTVISFAIMLVIGRIVTPLFLVTSGSMTLVKSEFRLFFIFSQVILPWMAGIIILFLITIPNYYVPLILKTLTPVLVLFPTLYLYDSLEYENIHATGVIQRNYFRWGIIIAVIALLFFYRLILAWGLKVT
jgi:hypothetical protein